MESRRKSRLDKSVQETPEQRIVRLCNVFEERLKQLKFHDNENKLAEEIATEHLGQMDDKERVDIGRGIVKEFAKRIGRETYASRSKNPGVEGMATLRRRAVERGMSPEGAWRITQDALNEFNELKQKDDRKKMVARLSGLEQDRHDKFIKDLPEDGVEEKYFQKW